MRLDLKVGDTILAHLDTAPDSEYPMQVIAKIVNGKRPLYVVAKTKMKSIDGADGNIYVVNSSGKFLTYFDEWKLVQLIPSAKLKWKLA